MLLWATQSWKFYTLCLCGRDNIPKYVICCLQIQRGSTRIVFLSSSRNPIWNSSCNWNRSLIKLISHHFSASLPRAISVPRGHLGMFGDIVTSGEAVLLASSGKRPQMLLSIPQCKTHPDQNININTKTGTLRSSVLR